MAFLGEESQWAAEAAECAGEQAKFWEYHDTLFASQNGENQGAFSKDNLKKFAADLKLDTAKFNQCLDSGKYTDKVKKSNDDASQLGVSSTPTDLPQWHLHPEPVPRRARLADSVAGLARHKSQAIRRAGQGD